MNRARTAWTMGAALGLAALPACVPEGPATASEAAPTSAGPAPVRTRPKDAAPPRSGAPITDVFEDDFERAELGSDWNALGRAWRIESGRLCARGARNRGVWLRRRLPANARIEIDAIAGSPDGDLKLEAWGDGVSGATGASYTNATSYLFILGGWRNTKHVLARLDEHGDDRLALDVSRGSDDHRERPVEAGQVYRFAIERADGRTVSWSVDGVLHHELEDPEPLAGPGHEHFGLNEWEAPVCFDNLKITAL